MPNTEKVYVTTVIQTEHSLICLMLLCCSGQASVTKYFGINICDKLRHNTHSLTLKLTLNHKLNLTLYLTIGPWYK